MIVLQNKKWMDSGSLSLLPLESLSWKDFERFVRILVRINGDMPDARSYGVSGDCQDGIDIECLDEKTIIQCKHFDKPFRLADMKAAIDRYKKSGRRDKRKIIAVSSTVVKNALEYAKSNKWEVWNCETLTDMVFDMGEEKIKHFIKQMFPNTYHEVLKACFSIEFNCPVTRAEAFLNKFDNEDRLFSLNNPYIKACSFFDDLKDNIEHENHKIFFISGSGGSGKTRLLKELSIECAKDFYFLNEDDDINTKNISGSLSSNDVLVIDDAHRRISDVQKVISAFRCLDDSKMPNLIIVTRDYDVGIFDSLSFSDYEKIKKYSLERLNIQHSIELIEGICGKTCYEGTLLKTASGNPLILSLGAQMIKKKKNLPRDIATSALKDYMRTLYKGFDEDFLKMIALIQPIETTGDNINSLSRYLGIDPRECLNTIRKLKDSGLLRGKDDTVRIAPDLLGDYLCELTFGSDFSDNEQTIKAILNSLDDCFVPNFIKNVLQLDWRLADPNNDTIYSKMLLRPIWEYLYNLKSTSCNSLDKLLGVIENIAFYQPSESINIIRSIMDSSEINAKILSRASKIASLIAHNFEYVGESINLIIAMSDKAKRYPDYTENIDPILAIEEMAQYGLYKPSIYVKCVISKCIALKDHIDKKNMFKILKKAIRVDGTDAIADENGRAYTLQYFKMNYDSISMIYREIATFLLGYCANSTVPMITDAIELIGELLKNLYSYKDDNSGVDLMQEIIRDIKNLIEKQRISEEIAAKFYIELHWLDEGNAIDYRCYSNNPIFATSILLIDPYGNSIRCRGDYKEWQKEKDDIFQSNARIVLDYYIKNEHSKELILKIKELLSILGIQAYNMTFLIEYLCVRSETFCNELIQYILKNPVDDDMFGPQAQCAFNALITTHKKNIDTVLNLYITSKRLPLIQSASTSIIVNADIFSENVLSTYIQGILALDNHLIDKTIIDALYRVNKVRKHIIGGIIAQLMISNKIELANDIARILTKKDIIDLMEIPNDAMQAFFVSLLNINEISSYEICDFLKIMADTNPNLVLKLFKNRIDHKTSTNNMSYEPIGWNQHSPVFPEDFGLIALGSIIEWLLDKKNIEAWQYYFWVPKLIKIIPIDKSFICDKVNSLLATSQDDKNIAIARILMSSLPQSVLFDDLGFVEGVLSKIDSGFGDSKNFKIIESEFYLLGRNDSKMGTPGEPFQVDLDLREKTSDILQKISVTSASYRLYRRLNDYANDEIKRARREY